MRFIRVSAAIFACSTPCEERRPAIVASRSSSEPSTLTNTLAARRSGLVSTDVTVTKPMRGSLSSAMAAPITSRSTSLMRRMRGVGHLSYSSVCSTCFVSKNSSMSPSLTSA